ncbi:MAG: hypothetical protein WBF83_09415 [Moheibacter sp.]
MKNFNQTIIPFVVLMFGFELFIGCKNENKTTEVKNFKTSEISENHAPEIIPLPDMNFDLEQFGEKEIQNNQPLSGSDLKELQIDKIDKYFPDTNGSLSGIDYYLLKEMYSGIEGKILLISRTSEMENNAWLATYDTKDQLTDSKKVFYDEWAESMMQTTSEIKNNTIIISEHELDMEAEKTITKTKAFQVGKNLKFVENHS